MDCLRTYLKISSLLVLMFMNVDGKLHSGVLTITGCTESFVQMKCPGEDVLSIHDVRLELTNNSAKCVQHLPAKEVMAPIEIAEQCDIHGEHCVYVEDICEGMRECAFYISPHMINDKENPTEDTEVVIEYNCYPGKSREAGFVILIILAVVGIISVVGVGGLIIWKDYTAGTSNYSNFTNDGSATAGPAAIPGNLQLQQQTAPEHISVQLQTPGAGNPAMGAVAS